MKRKKNMSNQSSIYHFTENQNHIESSIYGSQPSNYSCNKRPNLTEIDIVTLTLLINRMKSNSQLIYFIFWQWMCEYLNHEIDEENRSFIETMKITPRASKVTIAYKNQLSNLVMAHLIWIVLKTTNNGVRCGGEWAKKMISLNQVEWNMGEMIRQTTVQMLHWFVFPSRLCKNIASKKITITTARRPYIYTE